jgi:GrpB-like predicted nucleotidyltransferase (UPF0157 family)
MPFTEEQIRAYTIGELRPLAGPILIVEYSALWPELFELEAHGIRRALLDTAVRIEHIGSTSVPGLMAKPIIDIRRC